MFDMHRTYMSIQVTFACVCFAAIGLIARERSLKIISDMYTLVYYFLLT